MSTEDSILLWVCEDCYSAHEGISEHERGRPYINDPLNLIEDAYEVTSGLLWDDHAATCSNRAAQAPVDECECDTIDFATGMCQGCGFQDHGSRHALTIWPRIGPLPTTDVGKIDAWLSGTAA